MPDAVVIDDLDTPRLPLAVRTLNAAPAALARRVLPLDTDALVARARRRTGLVDFGDEGFRTALEALRTAIAHDARLTTLGRLCTRDLLVGLLGTRLRMRALLARHPEILEQPVPDPVVILGLPRTGTTHLHNLLAADDSFRSLPYWESLEPIPALGHLPSPDPDPRVRRCARALAFQHRVMPHFARMHEMHPEARHEEIGLLAVSFSTMLFEAIYQLPTYRDWYLATDQTPAYRELRRLLQILRWLRGPSRWLLKSPQHLEQLGPLFAVFPDARVVQTHRDPVRVTASMATMAGYGLRMNVVPPPAAAIGRYWADRIERMLRANVADRPRVASHRILDVGFDAFMADQPGTIARVYDFLGTAPSESATAAMRRYVDAHPRGRRGTVRYRLDLLGLDDGTLRRRLAFYQERFAVPDE